MCIVKMTLKVKTDLTHFYVEADFFRERKRNTRRNPYIFNVYRIKIGRKKVKGQPTIIIWRNLVVLVEYPTLHTKCQNHWLFDSGEDLLRFLPCIGMAAILIMWIRTFVPTTHKIWLQLWLLKRRCLKMLKMLTTEDDGYLPYLYHTYGVLSSIFVQQVNNVQLQ